VCAKLTITAASSLVTTINSVADLKAFRDSVNAGDDYTGETVTLNANLDLSGENWTPIGTSSYPFKGTFNGNGYVISNMTITNGNQYSGLFGKLDSATIKNLGLESVSVTASYETDIGGLAGNAKSTTISQCYVTGSVTGYAGVGGILGSTHSSSAQTIIENCYARVDLTGIDDRGDVSGISGWNGGSSVKITNCYSACTGEQHPVAGWSDGVGVSNTYLSNSYFDATLTPNYSTAADRAALARTSDQLKTQSTFTGWDFTNIWVIDPAVNGGYPYLRMQSTPVATYTVPVTFKVVNGTWADGTTKDKTVLVELTNGKGTLSANDVPTGMIANANYENGSWDVTPVTTANGITGDVTYTYSFTEHVPVITNATVTFKVVNGTWADGTTANKTVTVTLSDGKGTLSASDVPTGMIANANYENGSWDVTPVTTANGITGDVTYTYSFVAAVPTTYTVTVNGSYASTTGAGSYEAGEIVYIYAGNRDGYSFDGWTSSDVTINNANSKNAYFTMPAGNVTVTANWEYNGGGGVVIPTTYTLTFDTNGGSEVKSVRGVYGTTIDLTKYTAEKNGYEFAGWYADKALTEKVTSVKLTKNMTVYAKWTEIPVDDEPCDGGANCPTNYFTDVDQSQWYHEGIDFVVENDMMKGVGNNKFDPHGVTSRAMIVTILYRLEGEPAVSGENPFSDVANGTWYTDAVIWAEANGIVNGYGDGKFGPNDDITREQMAKIMYNYAEYKGYDVSARASLASFSDAGKISSWATEEMQWAVAIGLINGMGDGTVAPQGDAERCQVAAIFMRFCDKYVK